jgi:hypothetical protein
MRDRDIDDALHRAASASPEPDPALLGRIANSIRPSLQPVRPMASSGVLAAALITASVAVASTGASILGLHGIRAMSGSKIAVIFPVLLALICLAAVVCAGQMAPGSRHRGKPWVWLVSACVALTAVFALLFTDYRSESFVSQGVACLKAGLLHAIPAAIISWWVLHRGFAVNSLAAGVAVGTLSGLAGVAMLELHCANFEAPHIMLWHTGVLALSGAAGAVLVWAGRLFSRTNTGSAR